MGKGFAIGSAALTALALFAVHTSAVGLARLNLIDPQVVIGLFTGCTRRFFAATTMTAVGRAAV